jgi:Ca2+/Na+ antiporter
MIWLQFAVTALVIIVAGVRLARYGDVLGEKTGLGRSWIGVVLLAATTSLPELFTVSAPRPLPPCRISLSAMCSAAACSTW